MDARKVGIALGVATVTTIGVLVSTGITGAPFSSSGFFPEPLTANLLRVGVVDAGTVYTHNLLNVDGGQVYAPNGLALDSMQFVRFNGPGGNSECHHTGGALVCNGGGGNKFGIIGGGFSQEEFKAGELSATSLEITGSSGQALVSAVLGTGSPVADAGIDMFPTFKGVVRVWGEGLRAHQVQNADGGGALDLRGDVQIDDRRPVVALDAGTARQALAVGCVTTSSATATVAFAPSFGVAPVCVCSSTGSATEVRCVADTSNLFVDVTVDGTVCWICVEMR